MSGTVLGFPPKGRFQPLGGPEPTNEYPGTCEVCGEPAVLVARIGLHKKGSSCVYTDPNAKPHPRCGAHARSAYEIEGEKYPRWA